MQTGILSYRTNEDGSQRIDIDNGSVFITITQEGGIQFQLTRSSVPLYGQSYE